MLLMPLSTNNVFPFFWLQKCTSPTCTVLFSTIALYFASCHHGFDFKSIFYLIPVCPPFEEVKRSPVRSREETTSLRKDLVEKDRPDASITFYVAS